MHPMLAGDLVGAHRADLQRALGPDPTGAVTPGLTCRERLGWQLVEWGLRLAVRR